MQLETINDRHKSYWYTHDLQDMKPFFMNVLRTGCTEAFHLDYVVSNLCRLAVVDIIDFTLGGANLKQEGKKTLERELARAKITANRVAVVVANEWKDSNDKVMPVKQWLDERRFMQVGSALKFSSHRFLSIELTSRNQTKYS